MNERERGGGGRKRKRERVSGCNIIFAMGHTHAIMCLCKHVYSSIPTSVECRQQSPVKSHSVVTVIRCLQ